MFYLVKGKLVQLTEDDAEVTATDKEDNKYSLVQGLAGWIFKREDESTYIGVGQPTKGEAIAYAQTHGLEVRTLGKQVHVVEIKH